MAESSNDLKPRLSALSSRELSEVAAEVFQLLQAQHELEVASLRKELEALKISNLELPEKVVDLDAYAAQVSPEARAASEARTVSDFPSSGPSSRKVSFAEYDSEPSESDELEVLPMQVRRRSILNNLGSVPFESTGEGLGGLLASSIHPRSFLESKLTHFLEKFFNGSRVEMLMFPIVLLHNILLGIHMEAVQVGAGMEVKVGLYAAECVLTAFLVVEALGRCFVLGARILHPSTPEDVVSLVCSGSILPGLIIVVALYPAGISFLEDSSRGVALRLVMATRFLHWARLYCLSSRTRSLRTVQLFLRGIADSAVFWVWSVMIILGVTFTFAVFGVALISSNVKVQLATTTDPDEAAVLEFLLEKFVGTVPLFMYTLSKIMTGQITASTFLADINARLGSSWLFFHTYWVVMDLLILNLITATLVDTAIGTNQQAELERREAEEAAEAKRHLTDLTRLFWELDPSQNGALSWAILKDGLRQEEIKAKWKALKVSPEEARNCFRLLDREGNGEVPVEDFFQGLQRMQGVAQSRDLFQVLAALEDVVESVRSGVGTGFVAALGSTSEACSPAPRRSSQSKGPRRSEHHERLREPMTI